MANYQNNMRYDRQMNFQNGCRPMPAYNNNPCSNIAPAGRPDNQRRPGCGECPTVESARKLAPGQCEKRYDPIADAPLAIAMAYVPWQKWRDVMKPHEAIRRGTIFKELSLPFHGRGGCNR
ncbi:spore coat associated protein CotJA [Clostridium sp. C105KSO13]|uniref:spore coat associated protein CotJA n=1 Tax=Clostridium sp. C105KSO13 TaxID=1776045 RepID=UPI0007406835|nr:spore coat associated protein CotJA [Clostridium sp. C105KSO13]CUX33924.1 Spore coat associated protein JA (CotJA) [Clostridium sp. C105KSO13]